MITLMLTIMMMLNLSMLKTMNPVKMSITLLIFSSLIFLILFEKTQNMWYPSIFFLLFTGGILIMFMILSALMPNQKSKKLKIGIYLPIMLTIWTLTTQSNNFSESAQMMIKWVLYSNNNMEFILTMMMIYFFMFIIMMSKEKMSLKSTYCHKKKNFVSF